MSNQLISHWLLPMSNRWLIEDKIFCGLLISHRCHWLVIDVIDYSFDYLLITHWLPIDYSSITNFPPASANNMEKYPFFIEMMFTSKWSYNAGETDWSKKTLELSLLRHMQTKRCSQQILFIFDCTFSLIS